jgi:N-acetylglucosamine repressor
VRQLTKATHQQTRAYNQQLVLKTIYDHAPTSRADVARMTGLTRTSVSQLVDESLAAGLVEEVGRGRSSGGKAPILLRVDPDAREIIGLDVGERTFVGALVDLRGHVKQRLELPFTRPSAEEAVELIHRLVTHLRRSAERPILGIGVGTPGLVDTRSGTVHWAVNLDWQELPLGPLLEKRHGLPVSIANDSHAAALAEFMFGSPRKADSMVVIKVGQGVGAGIVLEGRLYQGDGSAAGEIGHVGAADRTLPCRCGSVGCLETVASVRAMLERAAGLARSEPASLLHDPAGALSPAAVADAADRGDETARAVIDEGGRALGAAIAGVMSALDVRRFVLVGTAVGFGERWLAAVRAELTCRALRRLAATTDVQLGRSSQDIVAVGASALLMTRELGLSLAR